MKILTILQKKEGICEMTRHLSPIAMTMSFYSTQSWASWSVNACKGIKKTFNC